MFQYSKIDCLGKEGILVHHTNGNSFRCIPEHGAVLIDVQLNGQAILDAYQNQEELETNFYYKSALLAPFPNRLQDGKFTFEGKTYQFPINDTNTQNALHGFIYDKPFEIEEIHCLADEACISLVYHYNGHLSYYPFSFRMRVEYTIKSNHVFEVALEITNLETFPIPIGMGWHPYFKLSTSIVNDLKLQLPPLHQLEIDDRMLPTGELQLYSAFDMPKEIGLTKLDTGFKYEKEKGRIELFLQDQNYRLKYWQEAVPFDYIQLFIPDGRASIAIEPMSCAADAFNSNTQITTLAKGTSRLGKCGVLLTPN